MPPDSCEEPWFFERCSDIWKSCFTKQVDFHCANFSQSSGKSKHVVIGRNVQKSFIFPPQGGFNSEIQYPGPHFMVESYLYACPKVGHARNCSRTACLSCFNGRFLKQAILGSKQLAGKPVDRYDFIELRPGSKSPLWSGAFESARIRVGPQHIPSSKKRPLSLFTLHFHTCKQLLALFEGGHVEEWVEGSTFHSIKWSSHTGPSRFVV